MYASEMAIPARGAEMVEIWSCIDLVAVMYHGK